MGKKVSKNSRVNRGGGGKDYIKIVVPIKNEENGSYTYVEKMVHKDKKDEYLAQFKN